jgi:hypothetical protein
MAMQGLIKDNKRMHKSASGNKKHGAPMKHGKAHQMSPLSKKSGPMRKGTAKSGGKMTAM